MAKAILEPQTTAAGETKPIVNSVTAVVEDDGRIRVIIVGGRVCGSGSGEGPQRA